LIVGAILIAAGIAIAVIARQSFVRAGTSVEPWKPSLTLVTSGIFAWMRNPMYVGAMLLLAGLAVALASDWTLVLLVPAALVLHFGVVRREERYLEAKFGATYRDYVSRVPRYGWPG
jgi:protein-S-isoprenylcysteine O-methyltransferase Ste14